MKNENVKKYTIIGLISLLVLAVIGVAYAYFGLEVEGTGKDIVMDTGDLRLEYMDDQELSLVGATPGDSISKTITVKNVGTREVTYTLYWGDLINTIENFELHITMECKSYKNYGTDTQEESGTCDRIYRAVPISDTATSGTIKNNISIDVGITHEYSLTVTFDDKNYEQNYNKNKKFTGKIGIEEYKAPEPIYCTYDGELKFGTQYTNGKYTYRYGQSGTSSFYASTSLSWNTSSSIDGWGVQFNDKASTDPVTEVPCTYINNIPVTSVAAAFGDSKPSSIDLSNWNMSNVTDMSSMFYRSAATEIKGLENFDTSNVTDMSRMFSRTNVKKIDLGDFDTSNVTDMDSMFQYSYIEYLDLSSFNTSKISVMYLMFGNCNSTSVDLSSFDTSNVTRMQYTFSNSNIKYLDLSSFNTSKVTTMEHMFYNSTMEKLDLSSFDGSNLGSMAYMFYGSQIPSIDLSDFTSNMSTSTYRMFANSGFLSINLKGFDTSSVKDMYGMFENSKVKSLDLSSFNTSKVTDMSNMFYKCPATEIKGLEKFDTGNVTSMNQMFYESQAALLNVNNFNTSKVTDMSSMFRTSKTEMLDVSGFDTSSVTNMSYMFSGCDASEIKGFEKFNTSNVTNMRAMFQSTKITNFNFSDSFNTSNVTYMGSMFSSSKAIVIDVSGFDTSKVTNMDYMFGYNYDLKTIYASDKFVTSNVTSSGYMFNNCTNLVGSAGTIYDKSKVDKTYARIDGGTDAPGYFTLKSN